jgi:hypothetical protein
VTIQEALPSSVVGLLKIALLPLAEGSKLQAQAAVDGE